MILCGLWQVAGTAIGLNLLLGFPILPSVLVLAFDGIIVQVVLPIVVRLSFEIGVKLKYLTM
jgi:manganese transport protein